jgi:hypothetical protein
MPAPRKVPANATVRRRTCLSDGCRRSSESALTLQPAPPQRLPYPLGEEPVSLALGKLAISYGDPRPTERCLPHCFLDLVGRFMRTLDRHHSLAALLRKLGDVLELWAMGEGNSTGVHRNPSYVHRCLRVPRLFVSEGGHFNFALGSASARFRRPTAWANGLFLTCVLILGYDRLSPPSTNGAVTFPGPLPLVRKGTLNACRTPNHG